MFYYVEVQGTVNNTAHIKAPSDACSIMKQRGYCPIVFKDTDAQFRLISKYKQLTNWLKVFSHVGSADVLVMQYPISLGVNTARFIRAITKIKKFHLVVLVHDIDSLRGFSNTKENTENEKILKMADQIICHNNSMKKWMEKNGYVSSKIVPLEVFDYIKKGSFSNHPGNKSVIIAGNLSNQKSPYIKSLLQLERRYPVYLFGPNFSTPTNAHEYKYFGSFSPEELDDSLQGDYGLVWDGESIDECGGLTGNYLRYNNPHKVSLYIASGIPVIIWKEAALSQYIEENNLGFSIGSLKEIQERILEISNEEYNIICQNAMVEGEKLRKGYYLNKALKEVERRYSNMDNSISM